jgi:polyhydroxybutyrate depolymerase
MQGRILALVCAMGVFLSAAVCGQPASGQSTRTIQSGGGERSYLLHVPAGYAGEAISLVLNFHGSGGAPGNQLATSGFDALADAEGFAVAFPAGVFANSVSQRSWNANLDPGVDDVQFARDVIADVSATLNIDPSRIYATGFSGGARMTSRLACELADILAAAAPVAGLQYPDGCTPVHGVPILALHSKADPVNQYEVGADSRPYWRMGVETAVDRWRDALRCEGQGSVRVVAANAERRSYAPCRDGSEVGLIVTVDGGHTWPEGASATIWSFFAAHHR